MGQPRVLSQSYPLSKLLLGGSPRAHCWVSIRSGSGYSFPIRIRISLGQGEKKKSKFSILMPAVLCWHEPCLWYLAGVYVNTVLVDRSRWNWPRVALCIDDICKDIFLRSNRLLGCSQIFCPIIFGRKRVSRSVLVKTGLSRIITYKICLKGCGRQEHIYPAQISHLSLKKGIMGSHS